MASRILSKLQLVVLLLNLVERTNSNIRQAYYYSDPWILYIERLIELVRNDSGSENYADAVKYCIINEQVQIVLRMDN